jgi:hypothetical protein
MSAAATRWNLAPGSRISPACLTWSEISNPHIADRLPSTTNLSSVRVHKVQQGLVRRFENGTWFPVSEGRQLVPMGRVVGADGSTIAVGPDDTIVKRSGK